MSIYVSIPGMQMPKVCNDCPFDYDNISCVVLNKGFWREDLDDYKGKLTDCPLVEVTPHGRLIDADALFKAMFQCSDGSIIGDKDIDGWPHEARYADIKRFIRQATPIIPADPEGGADGCVS